METTKNTAQVSPQHVLTLLPNSSVSEIRKMMGTKQCWNRLELAHSVFPDEPLFSAKVMHHRMRIEPNTPTRQEGRAGNEQDQF